MWNGGSSTQIIKHIDINFSTKCSHEIDKIKSGRLSWLVCCMEFNAVFISISVISRWPVHLFMLSWSFFLTRALRTIFFPSHWLLSHQIIVETTDSIERGKNPVAMTIINPRKEYWPSRGSNERPPVRKSATLPTELWGSVRPCNPLPHNPNF